MTMRLRKIVVIAGMAFLLLALPMASTALGLVTAGDGRSVGYVQARTLIVEGK